VGRPTSAVEGKSGCGGNEFFVIKTCVLNNLNKYGGSHDVDSPWKNVRVFYPNQLPAGGEPPLKK
jgi:hypothetical protein